VRRWAALEPAWSSEARVGLRQHFRLAPWTDYVEVHWRRPLPGLCHAGRTQGNVRRADRRQVRPALRGPADAVSRAWPAACRGAAGKLGARGDLRLTRLRHLIRGRLALIGDASGSIDAITGEGLALAFRQATMLAEASSRDELTISEAAHRRIGRMPRLISRLVLGLGRRAGGVARSGCWRAGRARSSGCWRCMSAHCGPRRPHSAQSALPVGC
jgi:hypothetical protein